MKMGQHRKPTAMELLERDFVKCRARILEIAAFIDRIDRFEGSDGARKDFRYRAIFQALEIISSVEGNRVREILLLLSDPTLQPLEDVLPPQRAQGAWRPPR
ncbi:hypothetical protein [Geotalea sp. SG265]|uniref:hypothetical protein n=1 Tax=Geotalea sp. SG265 TaxID=2922867 RepID=UPI001FAFFBAC|nr:hypothetical protein [Geotalea sp. SG265]